MLSRFKDSLGGINFTSKLNEIRKRYLSYFVNYLVSLDEKWKDDRKRKAVYEEKEGRKNNASK